MEKLVIALGGNALQEGNGPATAEAQLEVVEKTSVYIADIIEKAMVAEFGEDNVRRMGTKIAAAVGEVENKEGREMDACVEIAGIVQSWDYVVRHYKDGTTTEKEEYNLDVAYTEYLDEVEQKKSKRKKKND